MSNHDEKIDAMQGMGSNHEVAPQKVLKAVGSAASVLKEEGTEKQEAAESREDDETFTHVGKTSEEVLDHYGQQILGETYFPEVREKIKAGYLTTQSSLIGVVELWNEFDTDHRISATSEEFIQTVDTKMKAFDEQHNWSETSTATAAPAIESTKRALDNVQQSFRNLVIATPTTKEKYPETAAEF